MDDIKIEKQKEEIHEEKIQKYIEMYKHYFSNAQSLISIEQVEETMQKIMDTYAGGIGSSYQFNETGLELAREKLEGLLPVVEALKANDMDELLQIYELKERITVCFSVIEHLKARKETRWHSFAENMNYPEESSEFNKYVNSYKENGEIHILERKLIDANHKLIFTFDNQNKIITGGEAI